MSNETLKQGLGEASGPSLDRHVQLGRPEASGTGTVFDPELIKSNIMDHLRSTAERAAHLASRVRDEETLSLAIEALNDVLEARKEAEDAGIRISDSDELLRA